MVRYIRSNQVEELTKSAKGLNVKDVWYRYFDGTYESVENICKILGIEREYIVEAYIPNGVTSISDNAFSRCYSLKNITIPNSVTSIGNSAFEDCTSLTSVTIPDSVTRIGESAFAGCESLTSIKIPDSVREIDVDAFFQCNSLTNVTIPDSVTEIGDGAFGHCPSLKSVTIGNGVTKIGRDAFVNYNDIIVNHLIITTNNPYVIEYCMENYIDYIDVSPSR